MQAGQPNWTRAGLSPFKSVIEGREQHRFSALHILRPTRGAGQIRFLEGREGAGAEGFWSQVPGISSQDPINGSYASTAPHRANVPSCRAMRLETQEAALIGESWRGLLSLLASERGFPTPLASDKHCKSCRSDIAIRCRCLQS